MKNIKNQNLCLFAIILLVCNLAKAQEVKRYVDKNGQKITETTVRYALRSGDTDVVKKYKGSNLFNDTFQTGKFRLDNGKLVEAPIIFDILKQEFYIEVDKKNYTFKNKDFSIEEHNFIAIDRQYYEVLNDGSTKLLKKYTCRFINLRRNEGEISKDLYEFDGEFFNETSYYFMFASNKLEKIKLNKKSILAALKKENTKLFDYISSNVSEINTIEELIKIIQNQNP
jgi:hypothetical protein